MFNEPAPHAVMVWLCYVGSSHVELEWSLQMHFTSDSPWSCGWDIFRRPVSDMAHPIWWWSQWSPRV